MQHEFFIAQSYMSWASSLALWPSVVQPQPEHKRCCAVPQGVWRFFPQHSIAKLCLSKHVLHKCTTNMITRYRTHYLACQHNSCPRVSTTTSSNHLSNPMQVDSYHSVPISTLFDHQQLLFDSCHS